jgi:hypothetical protein
MSDEFDRASDLEIAEREFSIEKARNKVKYKHHGFCNNCGEPSVGRFCDEFCRDDFERIKKSSKINGW